MADASSNSKELRLRTEKRDGAMFVAPSGEVDLVSSTVLRQELKRIQAERPERLVIDLSEVPYMDSAGVATLVEAMQTARKTSTKLVLCCMQEKVRSIFEISRLDTVFTIVDSPGAAVAR